jgi:hypothetical protein
MPDDETTKYKQQMPIIAEDLIGIGTSTDFSKLTEKLYSIDQIDMTSDLSGKDICKLTILYGMAVEYELPMLAELCEKFITLRVSMNRKGRDEGVNMATAILGLKKLDLMEKAGEGIGKK